MLEEERNRILTKQKQRMKELQKLLTIRAKAYDSHQSLAQMSKSRVKSLRYHKRILNLQIIGFQTFFLNQWIQYMNILISILVSGFKLLSVTLNAQTYTFTLTHSPHLMVRIICHVDELKHFISWP